MTPDEVTKYRQLLTKEHAEAVAGVHRVEGALLFLQKIEADSVPPPDADPDKG